MTDGKIAEFRTGQTYQSGIHFIAQRQRLFSDSGTFSEKVWSVSNTGLPIRPASQREQRENGYSANCCGIYCQTATYTDHPGKEICKIQRSPDQQNGPYCAGRIFSKAESCQKRRNKLKYHIRMIACGSRNSRRFTICLLRPVPQLLQVNIPLMN